MIAHRAFKLIACGCSIIILLALALWPYSFFYELKWWVGPYSTSANVIKESAILISYRGCLMFNLRPDRYLPARLIHQPAPPGSTTWLPRNTSRILSVPYWCIALLSSLPPMIWLYTNKLAPIRRTKSGVCVKCGYDLRFVHQECPECGYRVPNQVMKPTC